MKNLLLLSNVDFSQCLYWLIAYIMSRKIAQWHGREILVIEMTRNQSFQMSLLNRFVHLKFLKNWLDNDINVVDSPYVFHNMLINTTYNMIFIVNM